MTLKTPALFAAALLGTATFLGCDANETDSIGTTIDTADTDTVVVAPDDAAGSGGSAMDRIRSGAADATSRVEGMADQAGGDLAATADNLKARASDGVAAASDLAAGKLEEARGMIDQIREMVANRDFSGAQDMLNKLENMPMYDKLPASVTEPIAGLRDKIQAGLNAMNK